MKLSTNIVLTGNHGRTQPYVIQMTSMDKIGEFIYVHQNDETWPGEHAMLFDASSNNWLSRKGNEWYNEEDDRGGVHYNLKKSNIRIYFPQYSADTFLNNANYILNLSIHLHGEEIELGCFNFLRKDALACAPIQFDGMDEYYEYMDFEIPDPYELYYNFDDDSSTNIIKHNVADTAAMLYVSLFVVEPYDNKYIMKDGWTGAQNIISITDENELRLSLKYNSLYNELQMKLDYNYDLGALFSDYLKNVYYREKINFLNWDLVIMDESDIYYKTPVIITSDEFRLPQFTLDFNIDFINSLATYNYADFNEDYNEDFNNDDTIITIRLEDLKKADPNKFFDSWNNWKKGLFIVGSVSIFDYSENQDDLPFISIFSNKIPLTQELFSKMLNHGDFPSQINLNELNMNDYTINAINKIEKEVKTLTYNIESSKNHMIQPVFYQTRELNKIIIHPAVTENISLNLETYKPYVKRFLLQIEGVSFKEIGRTSQGIIFKIFGNMLPKSVKEGTTYILDQDMNLVTTGKYKYSF